MNISSSSGLRLGLQKEALTQASMAGEDFAELTWENGEVVTRSQNESSVRKTAVEEDAIISPVKQFSTSPTREGEHAANLFVQEDEIATWLNSPLDYFSDLYSDIVYPQPRATSDLATGSKAISDDPTTEFINSRQPPVKIMFPTGELPFIPPSSQQQLETSPWIPQEFSHFSSDGGGRKETETSGLKNPVKEFTVVESIKTPAAAEAAKYRAPSASRSRVNASTVVRTSFAAGIGANDSKADSDLVRRPSMMAEDLKRSVIQIEDSDSEGIAATSSFKRSRCAEVHNLSEKKRREKINDRMKALQELIPRSNKLDKASLLDETIEYLKSLQLQVQMMSMWYRQCAMLFPGFQQYIATMNMGMASTLMPFPQVLPGLNLLNSAQLGPRFIPWPTIFQTPPITMSDPSRIQTIRPPATRLNTTTMAVDSRQQYYGVGQTPIPSLPQQDEQGEYDQYNK